MSVEAVAAPETVQAPTAESIQPDVAQPSAESPQTGQEVPQKESSPRAEIDQFAESMGFTAADVAQFQTLDEAKKAFHSFVENIAQTAAGFDLNQYQQPQPPAAPPAVKQAPPAADTNFDLDDLGLEPDSPAAKAFQALVTKLGSTEQAIREIQEKTAAYERSQSAARQQQILSEAAQIVDSFQSPEFGVGQNRSRFQQMNLSRLYDIADDILIGYHLRNQPAPNIQQRLSLAKFYYDQERGVASNGNGNQSRAASAPALSHGSPAAANTSEKPLRINERWAPAVMEALGL